MQREIQLRHVAAAIAMSEYERGVRETSENWGPRIAEYLANCDPPIHSPAPWCAAFVQFCADRAAVLLGEKNPLDAVKQEAYVQSYYDWAHANGLVLPKNVRPKFGDLGMIYYPSLKRYGHIFFVVQEDDGWVWSIDGNSNSDGSREGREIVNKKRAVSTNFAFARW